jgi:plastocyanin
MGRIFAVLGLAIALLVAGLGTNMLVGAATRSVDVQDNSFVDGVSGNSTTTIAVGDIVQWTWTGSNPHTVDNNGGSESFSSGAPQTSGSFSHTFNTAGTYNYICGVHGSAMQGTIIVQAAQVPTSTPVPQSTNTPQPQASATASGATATSTAVTSTTAVAATATSASVSGASPTAAAPSDSTPVAPDGGALPSTGYGPAQERDRFDVIVAAFAIAVVAAASLGGLVLARRVVR